MYGVLIKWFATNLDTYCITFDSGLIWNKDQAERHELKSRFLLFILLFFFPFYLEGMRKGEKNGQSRDFMSCLSARFGIR